METASNLLVFESSRMSAKFATGFALLLGCFLGWSSGLITEARGWLIVAIAGFLGVYLIWDAAYVASWKIIVSDLGLTIANPLRIWGPRREFEWSQVKMLELTVRDERRSVRIKADRLPKYYYEDVMYDPALVESIVKNGKLTPVKGEEAPALTALPIEGKHVYRWAKK